WAEIPSLALLCVREVILVVSLVEIPHLCVNSARSAARYTQRAFTGCSRHTLSHSTTRTTRTNMDLHRASILNQMDYNRESKEGKAAQSTEERLDSGVDSLKEEEYQAVAEELHRLQLESERQQAAARTEEPLQEWQTQTTDEGDTLLHLAIIHEAKDYIKQMIDLSKNTPFLNAQNDLRQTPLHLAVITNQPNVCSSLLASGCDPTLVDNSGDTPLHIACRHGNLYCFSVITQNCRLEHLHTAMAACNYNGQNCLHLASVHGFLSLVEKMVDLGADVNAKEQHNGRSSLHLAVDQQNLALVKLLLRKGADPNLLSSGGHTPFHLTYGLDNCDIQKELFPVTHPHLRDLSESENSGEESSEEEEESDEEGMYDDIQWNGH
ncbi:hypothetical protein CCH79_00004733, partial [Gambusia affinis]